VDEGKDSDKDDMDDDENIVLEEEDKEDGSHAKEHEGWDLEKLRSNMFAFIDGSGNIVYEKIEEDDNDDDDSEEGDSKQQRKRQQQQQSKDDEEEEEKDEEKEEDDDDEEEEKDEEKESEDDDDEEEEKDNRGNRRSDSKAKKRDTNNKKTAGIITSSSVMTVNPETQAPQAVVRTEPLPRMKASLFLVGHVLYVYGGLLEVGDREVMLDDLWRLDLRKRDGWECVWAGTMHQQVWRGATHDDDDSYVSSTTGRSASRENDNDDDEDDGSIASDQEGEPKSTAGQEDNSQQQGSSNSKREEMAELEAQYGLSDTSRTPQPTEALADFYARTAAHWNEQAAAARTPDQGEASAKELKREGFALARERYEELAPIMERLRKLDVSSVPPKKEKSKKESKDKDKKESKEPKKAKDSSKKMSRREK